LSLFGEIRAAAAEVARRARFVHVDEAGVAALADALTAETGPPPSEDPAHHRFEDATTTLAFVITLDAVNFGSGWFPHLVKREGRSGYFTIAGALEDHVRARGPLSAADLRAATMESCAALFAQPIDDSQPVDDSEPVDDSQPVDDSEPVDDSHAVDNAARAELMHLFARAWNELGERLDEVHCGSFERLVSSAGGQAEALVRDLAELPSYRDECVYEGELRVPLYKRAQITVSDLNEAFAGTGPGAFTDLDDLTMFPDNLVPHVLRVEGALRYAPELLARIDAGELLEVGSTEEIEIRAVGLHAVERLVAACRERGLETNAPSLDHRLWHRGQAPRIKAYPRHRARCTYY